MKGLFIRNPDILLCRVDELSPEVLLEFGGVSIRIIRLFQILIELELIELLFLKCFEGILDGQPRLEALELLEVLLLS